MLQNFHVNYPVQFHAKLIKQYCWQFLQHSIYRTISVFWRYRPRFSTLRKDYAGKDYRTSFQPHRERPCDVNRKNEIWWHNGKKCCNTNRITFGGKEVNRHSEGIWKLATHLQVHNQTNLYQVIFRPQHPYTINIIHRFVNTRFHYCKYKVLYPLSI